MPKYPPAVKLGKLGGSANTPAQHAARSAVARANGSKSKGRPRKERPLPREQLDAQGMVGAYVDMDEDTYLSLPIVTGRPPKL